jgi:hypothetical protein
MQIRFAAERPQGAYALALPVMVPAKRTRACRRQRGLVEAALRQQRFEGEPSSIAEVFRARSDGCASRASWQGLAPERPMPRAEKVGAALAGRLLCSGETTLVVDVNGLGWTGTARRGSRLARRCGHTGSTPTARR